MNKIFLIFMAFGLTLNINAQQTGTFTDPRDEKTYKTVKIGNQVWMAQNLAYKPKKGEYCAYEKKSGNINKYGYLYSWETASESCPTGWHLPTESEWNELLKVAGQGGAALNLKSQSGWKSGSGNDSYGFSALASGYRLALNGYFFKHEGGECSWWSSTEKDAIEAYVVQFWNTSSFEQQTSYRKFAGMSVRCIKNSTDISPATTSNTQQNIAKTETDPNVTTTKPNEISSNLPAITLTNTRSKFDLSGLAAIAKITYPKTLETKLTGCVAGDCFDGFGYYIESENEEYCGYFVNGIKSFGQLHRPYAILIFNGYFENEQPNGYGNINFYENSLIVVGTFKNTLQDGEFTSYKYGDMKNGLSKGGQLTDITLKTGCLSGDCKTGNGVYQLEDGTRFIGDFNTSGMVKGVWFENKARVVKFEGVNSSNQFCGITDIFMPKGEVIHGNFLDGKMNGQGIIKTRLMSKTLCVEGTFENGLGTNITVQFRDGRKWIGAQETADVEWATGTGTMTYPDGTTKTGKFKDGEFVSE